MPRRKSDDVARPMCECPPTKYELYDLLEQLFDEQLNDGKTSGLTASRAHLGSL